MNVLLATAWPISDPAVECLGWVLVHSLWQLAVAALLTGLTVRMLRRNSATTRHGVLVVGMAVSVAAPVVTWMLEANNVLQRSTTGVESAPSRDLAAASSHETNDAPLTGNSVFASDAGNAVPTPERSESASPSDTASAMPPPVQANAGPTPTWSDGVRTVLRPWLAWLVAGWSLGVIVCSLRPLLGWHMLRRLRRVGVSAASPEVLAALERVSDRLGLRRTVHVLQSTLAQAPVVIGYMRPVILLPVSLATSIPVAQLEAILAHELAHVRRHDFAINLLQTLVETVFFYHPGVWWLSRRIRVEREHCCDDLVVRLLGNRVEYGRALLAIEEQRGRRAVLALGAADGSLLSRVRRIVGVGSDANAPCLLGRATAASLGLACLGLAVALSMNWGLAAKDAPPPKNPPDADSFGPESNGLRCRLIPVPATTDDEAPDLSKTANTFARSDDVTFAVELKNVSEKPVTLMGVRHANGQPGFDGKLAPEFFAPHLFEFEFTDADGKPVPRSSRVFFGMYHLLDGASVHEIAPGKSLVVLLRPARFDPPMDYRLAPGGYRAKVRYRGPGDKSLAYFRENFPDKANAKAWAGEATSTEATFTVAEDASVPKSAKLVWGPVKDGLQAALEFRSPPGIAPANDPPGTLPAKPWVAVVFHVKNMSDHTITFVSETGRQGDEGTATDDAGETKRLEGPFFTGWPILVRWTLKPGEVAELDDLTPGIGSIDKPGKYTIRFSINFASLSRNKGEGEFGFPKKDDWQQVLVTGDTPVTIRTRTAEDDAREQQTKAPDGKPAPKSPDDAKAGDAAANGEIVGRLTDSATGKPVAGATVACGAIVNESGQGGGANAITDDEGRYRLKVPSPGIYNVWLKKFDKDPSMTAAADDGIRVEAGKAAASQLQLIAGRKVGGKVVDADGKPVANLGVSCYSAARPQSGGVQSVQTKADGTFEFALPPGRAYINATELVEKTEDNPFGVGRSAHAHVQVSPTEAVAPLTLTLQEATSKFGDPEWLKRSTPGTRIVRREGNQDVTGVVVDGSGKPIGDARVFREDGPVVTTNDKGEFRIETMKGTQFVMHAVAPGYHVWFGTPTSGDVLKIVLESKQPPGTEEGAPPPARNPMDPAVPARPDAAGPAAPDGEIEKAALEILRTPFLPDPAKGSWQEGAHDAQVILSLSQAPQRDLVCKALLRVVDRTEPSEPDQRRLAITFLGGHAPARVIPLLIKELESAAGLPAQKFAAHEEIVALGRMGEDARDAVPALIKLLDSPDWSVRAEAMDALVQVGPSSLDAMNALTKRFDDPRAVYQAADYGKLARPLGPAFAKLLDSRSRPIRTWAAYGLAKSGFDEPRGLEVLIGDVAAGTAEDRSLSATALAALGSQAQSMIPNLRAYENDPDERVAKEVQDAIRRIERNDRIFTHAEDSARAAAARTAAAKALWYLEGNR